MADCTASGTAVDRVIQTAVASALRQDGGAATSSAAAAASRQAAQAFGSLGAVLGGTATATAATSAAAPPTQSIMPMAPLEMIGSQSSGGGMMNMSNNAAIMDNHQRRLEDAWSSSSSSTLHNVTAVAHPHPMQHQQMFHHPAMQMHPQQQQHMMMQQQQQQQMVMMQHMQMQQQQMAAMVQYQQQQQQIMQQQKATAAAAATTTQTNSINEQHEVSQEEDDDVATVSSQDELFHHEGFTDPASIERLAQAWRDAEAEYAQEFDNDHYNDGEEYDVSNIAGLYNNNVDATTTATGDLYHDDDTEEPHYEFSEASRTYGCVTTPLTDIAPTLNTTTTTTNNNNNNNNFPEDLFEQGLQHFDEGNLSEAILCFESTLRNIDPEHADAWRMLGRCHTENDEDSKAIVCMRRAIERDPFSPETLLALGVAYVNELDHERAVETLKSWVANHPLYAGMDMERALTEEEDLYGSGSGGGEEYEFEEEEGVRRGMRKQTMVEMRDVERLLLRALDIDNTADAAADVYEALGVVYNVSRDYDAAVDSFQRAIEVRPDDYQLRNKLGATLANSNRSEEALSSYRVALSLKPKYARGWLNMAIAHSNLHNYSEASRCYLQTLSLNQEAKHVWSYLRIALTCDEQWDLLPLAASQNLGAFHEHFDFVEY